MLTPFIFFSFSAILLLSAVMTVFSVQPIRSILWLALAFIATAALWIVLSAEFLGLMLVLVYVGAVLTLFLFVIMMLPTEAEGKSPIALGPNHLALLLGLIMCSITAYAIYTGLSTLIVKQFSELATNALPPVGSAAALGQQLYTQYIYPFELTGILLLVAIIACIQLSGLPHHSQPSQKRHKKEDLLMIKREERVQLVKGD